MGNPFAVSLWLGVALYAALGLFGVVFFHNATPGAEKLTDGYGIAYDTMIASETGK